MDNNYIYRNEMETNTNEIFMYTHSESQHLKICNDLVPPSEWIRALKNHQHTKYTKHQNDA